MTRALTERIRSMKYHVGLAAFALLTSLAPASADPLVARLNEGGYVLMIRHANAPGIGDPPGFKLDDCSTQRNLDEAGRAQAVAMGAWLRARGMQRAEVYSSQWCRCLETARLMNLGPVKPLPALNSFFERPAEAEATTRTLRAFLAERSPGSPPLVLVTHQVNISALAGTGLGVGEGVLLELRPGGAPRMVGHLDFR